MIDINKIAYSICHVPNNFSTRMKCYEDLLNDMPKELHNFPPSTVQIKHLENLDILEKEFSHLKMKNYVFPALWTIYNQQLVVDNVPCLNAKFPQRGGEIGLYLSVYKTFKRFLDSEYDYLIWFEDDTKVMPNMMENLKKYIEHINFDFDIISLGMTSHQLNNYVKEIHDIGNDYFCRSYQVFWAGTLLFSRQGMIEILSDIDQNSFIYPFDWYVFNIRYGNLDFKTFKTYNIKPEYPMLFDSDLEAGSTSTIGDTYLLNPVDDSNNDQQLELNIEL
jgi:GR25 family glycosyltransferase involved in LPS biosynthesis